MHQVVAGPKLGLSPSIEAAKEVLSLATTCSCCVFCEEPGAGGGVSRSSALGSPLTTGSTGPFGMSASLVSIF